MRLILLILCLTPLASAVWTPLFYCPSDGMYTDPLLYTQQVRSFIVSGTLVGMDSSSEADQSLSCSEFDYSEGDSLVRVSAKDSDGEPTIYFGNGTIKNNYSYMEVQLFVQLPDGELTPAKGVLGANSNGAMRMYFLYASDTEIVIRTCFNGVLGSEHSIFIFSSQADVISSLDSECLKERVKSLPYSDEFEPVMKTNEEIMACNND